MSRAVSIELMNMCMITNKKGQVLVEDRLNPNWPGITFPGGHVEYDESLCEAMIREIKEETGLTIYNPKLCGIKDWFYQSERCMVLLYQTTDFEGKIKSSDESRVFWLDPKELSNCRTAGHDFMTLYEVFTNQNISEMYYSDDKYLGILL